MRKCFPSLLLAFGFAVAAHAQDGAPRTYEELVEQLGGAVESVKSWSADVSMTMTTQGMEMLFTGSTMGKGPSISAEMEMNLLGQKMKMRTVVGADRVSWTEMEVGGVLRVMKADLNAMDELGVDTKGIPGSYGGAGSPLGGTQDPATALATLGEVYDVKLTGAETLNGVEVFVLEATFKEGVAESLDPTGAMAAMGMVPGLTRLYIGAEDGFARKSVVFLESGEELMTMEYTNVVINPELDDALFVYTPPEGVQVMDMTAMGAGSGGGGGEPEANGKYGVGEVAPDFAGNGVGVARRSLSDFRGKVVLVDFWATWCGPCVSELPNVAAAYRKHHAGGFEILGVSLDDDKADLTGFLEEHPEMSWPQIYDGGGWETPIAVQYGVQAIPHTLLIDREGNIHATDLRGEALAAAVAELLAGE